MEAFTRLTAVAAPLIRENIDTDAIIPSREMKSVSKQGLAEGLFAGWRYTAIGGRELNPDFVLNQPAYAETRFLLGGGNFGCGSSREHAAWALAEYGIRAVIAPSFNPIFNGNCIRNGIVPILLDASDIARLADYVSGDPQQHLLTVDLEAMRVDAGEGLSFPFHLPEEAREMLLYGLDAIDLTLRLKPEINAFVIAHHARRGWVYPA